MAVNETLKNLCTAIGVSGNEFSASGAALKLLQKYDDAAYIDERGTVRAKVGSSENLPTLLLEAHIDEIGMTVTYIEDGGFLRVGMCGGVDRRLLAASPVTIWGEKAIKGVIATLPPHVATDNKAVMKTEDIAVDTGYSKDELEKLVSLGDRITLDGEYAELLNGRVKSKAIDDRSGCASIIEALELIDTTKLKFNLEIALAVQEEVGSLGAIASAYSSMPQQCIAVDVSFALSPSCQPRKCGRMSAGVMLGYSPVLDRAMTDRLEKLANEYSIPLQKEIMPGTTGTDADDISASRGGVRCALLSIPERYMHTPVETVDLADITAVSRLIAAYATEGE